MLMGITLIISNLIYSFLIFLMYFFKEKIDLLETKLYGKLIVINLINLIVELLCCYTVVNIDKMPLIAEVINRLFLVIIFAWQSIFTLYIYIISFKDKYDKNLDFHKGIGKLFIVFVCLCLVLLMTFPLYYYNDNNLVYSYGPSANLLYGAVLIYFVSWVICYAKKSNNSHNNKKYLPILAFIFVMAVALIIRAYEPGFLIISSSFAFVTNLMFFTIENPDVKMIEQLEIAKSQADRANRAKTDFLSSMSHEIRTPLNAIVGFSDCIEQSESLDEAKENAKDIVNASKTLLEIVNGILDISKIEAGKLEIVNSSYHARSMFENLSKLIKPRIDEKGLDFEIFIAPDLPDTLYGDHANLKKIVTNLLSNAAKYTDTGFVKYEVNCVNSNDSCKLIISVEDSGRGVKKEDVDKLFTKFQRLDEDRNTTIEGTGLGLAITKQLIELMGGRIIVHTVFGEGSKFTVVLNQKIEKDTPLQEKKKIRTTLDLAGDRILLVDDNNLNLKVATKLLERYHATDIECVDSGFACLDKIKEGREYDVILLDDMMPKMSGVETLHKLREIPGFNTPVVILTANAITGMKSKYISEGFDGYLAKPIEKDKLIQVLNEVLEKAPTEVIHVDKVVNNNTLDQSNSKLLDNDVNYGEEYLRNNGIDMDNALNLLGDMEMYNDTLKDYLNEVDNKFLELKGYKENSDMKNYSILVHSMKSDAKYLGLMDFADIAYSHELKSKDGDIHFVNENFSKLEDELNKVLGIVREYAKHI